MGPKNRRPRAKAPVPDTTATTAAPDTTATTVVPDTTVAAAATRDAAADADTDAITGAGTSNRVPKVKAKPKAGQYHHMIPRFILRRFIIEGQ